MLEFYAEFVSVLYSLCDITAALCQIVTSTLPVWRIAITALGVSTKLLYVERG